ncbi:retrovirus-related pol polyprotein from transposon TNT 1-94 [Tanacetum coccineum]|uniref:Retrovirus-related pol polyprotein from transposon TNT 1-94 n=1 Tax=Tanacetum coccineum TaxID=301880 RepID=A0ABQ4WKP4_9ASTR
MKEGASVANHVNEFNSILSRLMSVDIKFDDEVQSLFLLSSLPESWSGTIIVVSGLTRTTKLKFDNIRDLILGEDIRRKTSGEYLNSLISAEDKGMGRKQDRGQKQNIGRSKSKKRDQSKSRQDITCWNCNHKGHFQNQCLKPVASRDKEVNMEARDSDDALEELERFKLRFDKVHLADDNSLDIASIRDVLDEEGYHVGFGDQQWKVTKGSLVVVCGNKHGSMYIVEVHPEGIGTFIGGSGSVALGFEDDMRIPYILIGLRIPQEEWRGKDTSLAHLKVFGCDSFVKVKDVRGEATKCTFIGSDLNEMRYNFRDIKSH